MPVAVFQSYTETMLIMSIKKAPSANPPPKAPRTVRTSPFLDAKIKKVTDKTGTDFAAFIRWSSNYALEELDKNPKLLDGLRQSMRVS